MPVRFDAWARRAIDLAVEKAETLGHSTLGTAHLLLGLLQVPGPGRSAAAVATPIGADLEALCSATSAALSGERPPAGTGEARSAAERVLRRASELAAARNGATISDLDILTAIAESPDTVAGSLLADVGVTADRVRDATVGLAEEARRPGDQDAEASSWASPGLESAAAGAGRTDNRCRVGIGYDSHRFAAGGPIVLGGIAIPYDQHLTGHSDGDAIAHAVTDAVLGAAAAGDIGEMFPDTDPTNRGRSSIDMLRAAVLRVREQGWTVQQVDITVIAQRPAVAPYRREICQALGGALGLSPSAVSVKGKTNEGMGWIGMGEGLACIAVATVIASERP